MIVIAVRVTIEKYTRFGLYVSAITISIDLKTRTFQEKPSPPPLLSRLPNFVNYDVGDVELVEMLPFTPCQPSLLENYPSILLIEEEAPTQPKIPLFEPVPNVASKLHIKYAIVAIFASQTTIFHRVDCVILIFHRVLKKKCFSTLQMLKSSSLLLIFWERIVDKLLQSDSLCLH